VKTELEQTDFEAIARKVAEMLLPLIPSARPDDEVFDKQGLADYLKVDISWIDRQITNRAIPFFKAGKYTRFKKSHIDRWIENRKVDPIPELKRYRRG
jgi:excisionase family DNA binding protein